MDWITERIAIGNYLEAQDAELLRKEAIASVLGLDKTLQGRDPAELGLRKIEILPLEMPRGTTRACSAGRWNPYGIYCNIMRRCSSIATRGEVGRLWWWRVPDDHGRS